MEARNVSPQPVWPHDPVQRQQPRAPQPGLPRSSGVRRWMKPLLGWSTFLLVYVALTVLCFYQNWLVPYVILMVPVFIALALFQLFENGLLFGYRGVVILCLVLTCIGVWWGVGKVLRESGVSDLSTRLRVFLFLVSCFVLMVVLLCFTSAAFFDAVFDFFAIRLKP